MFPKNVCPRFVAQTLNSSTAARLAREVDAHTPAAAAVATPVSPHRPARLLDPCSPIPDVYRRAAAAAASALLREHRAVSCRRRHQQPCRQGTHPREALSCAARWDARMRAKPALPQLSNAWVAVRYHVWRLMQGGRKRLDERRAMHACALPT